MPVTNFYDSQTEQSEVKTTIVRKYFWAWAKILTAFQKKHKKPSEIMIGYVDLFAGKGRYNDGTKSTPILILEDAVAQKDMSQWLYTYFNEENEECFNSLKTEIENIPNLKLLKHTPQLSNIKTDDSFADVLNAIPNLPPTLFFLDPFGYKDISLKLIQAVLKPFGCDCIFFLNYRRVNAAVTNSVMTKNMIAIFGADNLEQLRKDLIGKSAMDRENLVIQALSEGLKKFGGTYSIEYFFKDAGGKRTSHFIIFTTKNRKGYDLMKDIMARESSDKSKPVPSFGFNPNDGREKQFSLFPENPIENLANELLEKFRGKCLTVLEIFDSHNYGTKYVMDNYREAINLLEANKQITADPSAEKRIKGGAVTCAKTVKVSFPD